MRRVLLFAAFLLLLGLTTATAASFDVQAEDITSFSTPVSLTVPAAPVVTGTELFFLDQPQHAILSTTAPEQSGGNPTARLLESQGPIDTEADSKTNQGYPYVTWSMDRPSGMQFSNQIARVHFTRTNGTGNLTAAIYECVNDSPPSTTTLGGCTQLGVASSGSGTTEQIDIDVSNKTVRPGFEIRLKMINGSADQASIQWGYKEKNRPARIEIVAKVVAP